MGRHKRFSNFNPHLQQTVLGEADNGWSYSAWLDKTWRGVKPTGAAKHTYLLLSPEIVPNGKAVQADPCD